MRCLYCAHENPDTAEVCENCGLPIGEGQPLVARPLSPPVKHLDIFVHGDESQTPIPVILEKLGEALVLGRIDETDSRPVPPDIDLTAYDAYKKGVSRRHAQLSRMEGMVKLEDMNSKNGTFLNGQRLIPHSERIVRDGDDIRLGHLLLYVRFKYERWPVR